MMTDSSELDATLADLRRKAAKRRDVAGYGANVAAIEARIAALEAARAESAGSEPAAADEVA